MSETGPKEHAPKEHKEKAKKVVELEKRNLLQQLHHLQDLIKLVFNSL